MFLPRRYLQQRPLRPRTRARQSQSKPSSSFCVIPILLDPLLLALTLRLSRKLIRSKPSTLCARGPCVSKCREPTTPKRDVTEPRTNIAGGGSSNNFNGFQRRNTRFPANFIADRAAEDGGEEVFQHSSGCLKASSSPRRFRLKHDGSVSKNVSILLRQSTAAALHFG